MLEKIFLILYNILILLIPYNLNFHGITYSKILFLYSIFITVYLFIKKKINKNILKNKTFKYLTIGYLVFTIIVTLSVLLNTIIDKKIVFSNLLEIFRITEYYLTILNYYILINNNHNLKVFKTSFMIIVLFNVLLAFFQFHNLFNLNELYIKIIAPTQYETLIDGYKYPRAVGLAGNPNVFGFFITLASIYVLYLLLKNHKKWYYYLIYILLVITIFLTSSRTSYVSMIAGSGILIILSYFKFNIRSVAKTFIVGVVFIIFQLLLLFILPNSYTWRIKQLINLNSVNSWQNRIENNKDFINNLNDDDNKEEIHKNNNTETSNESIVEESKVNETPETNVNEEQSENNLPDVSEITPEPNLVIEEKKTQEKNKFYTYIIGNGPDKTNEKHKGYFDNEWFMFIFNYGFLGTICYLFMLIFPMFSIKKNRKFNYVIYISLVITNLVYMIAAASYNCYLLFNLFCILVAITINDKNFSKN